MKSKKVILLLAVACCFVVSMPTYSEAAPPVRDTAPTNFVELDTFYDYRDYGVGNRMVDLAEMKTGAYFQVATGIGLGGYLGDYTNVLSVTATHQPTGFELNLVADDPCTDFLGRHEKFWALYLRPASWMLTGTWEFTLTYNGSDGKRHIQNNSWSMGQTIFPVKPTYVQVTKGADFTVSWSGIGNSCSSSTARYRIRVYDDDNLCGVQEYRGPCFSCVPLYPNCEATGTYDPTSNRVTFHLPLEYEGRLVRLENVSFTANQIGRASQYITLF